MLIHLMESYIRTEKRRMEDDDTLNLMITDISVRNKKDIKKELIGLKREIDEELEPPMIPLTNDLHNDDWDDVSGVGWMSSMK